MKENIRINWIDTAKCFGMFFVVLGHLSIPTELVTWIYSFHMPLFFFLSGFVYKENTLSTKEMLIKKGKTILIPYVFLAISTYLFWLFIGRKYGTDASLDISPLKALLGIFYSNGINDWLIFNVPLWFITCLFCVEMIYNTIRKRKNKQLHILFILIISVLIGYLLIKLNTPRLPWGINVAFFALAFFGLGNLIKQTKLYVKFTKIRSNLILVSLTIIFVVLNFITSDFNGRIDMNENSYGNLFMFYISSILGIVSIICFSRIFEKNKIFIFYGKRTLIILGFHGITLSIIKAIQLFILGIPLETLSNNLFTGIIYSIITFILLIPLFFILENYFPYLIGKNTLFNKKHM